MSKVSAAHDPKTDHVTDGPMKVLRQQGICTGLATELSKTVSETAHTIWIIDNSGSMDKKDSHLIVAAPEEGHIKKLYVHEIVDYCGKENFTVKMVPCHRWTELQEAVYFQIEMAAELHVPTSFRLLNPPGELVGPQNFTVAEGEKENVKEEADRAHQIVHDAKPRGDTPLTDHINEIKQNVLEMETELVSNNKKVAIVIATDGLPTSALGGAGPQYEEEFVEAMKSLKGLPVTVAILLCTAEEKVEEYYKGLQAKISCDLLDCFDKKIKDVHEHNKWLNYSLALHRVQELGYHHELLDATSERTLTMKEMKQVCILLFGEDAFKGVPEPENDWNSFTAALKKIMENEVEQWNPFKHKPMKWVDVHALNKEYSGFGCEPGRCVIL